MSNRLCWHNFEHNIGENYAGIIGTFNNYENNRQVLEKYRSVRIINSINMCRRNGRDGSTDG